MKYHFHFFLKLVIAGIILSSCTSINKTIREPQSHVEFYKEDFVFSEQVTAEASTSKVFGIDFSRLILKKTGKVENGFNSGSQFKIPIIGNLFSKHEKTTDYALHELIQQNPGYDVVFYPQYEVKIVRPILGIGFLNKVITVRVTARLGKISS